MDRLSFRAVLILVGAFLLCFAVFYWLGVPAAGDGPRPTSTVLASLAAGSYSLTALAAIMFARGVLGLFVDFSRPVAFFRAMAGVADPFVALFGPLTPGFLHEATQPFYAAFCLYFVKFFIFGGFGAPPPWLLLLLVLG